MTMRSLTMLLTLFITTEADAGTSGELYTRCIYRYPGAAAACDRSINAIYQELKSSGLKCERADKAQAKEMTSAVLEYLHSHAEVHKEPADKVLKEAVRLAFRCD